MFLSCVVTMNSTWKEMVSPTPTLKAVIKFISLHLELQAKEAKKSSTHSNAITLSAKEVCTVTGISGVKNTTTTTTASTNNVNSTAQSMDLVKNLSSNADLVIPKV